ncbi:hypothetical protein [Dokdonia sp. Asnod2-E02]
MIVRFKDHHFFGYRQAGGAAICLGVGGVVGCYAFAKAYLYPLLKKWL